ncbi:MAG: hypothetical protein WD049_10020 [Candidatus Paceibacterota bacterium]
MKKSIFVAVMVLFGSCLGCGPGATDTTGTPPPPAQEEVTQEIEKALESEEIDPATYGQTE